MAELKEARLINFDSDTVYIVKEAARIWGISFTAALLRIVASWHDGDGLLVIEEADTDDN